MWASVNNKILAGKMAAINIVQYHPPPPLSFCEGLRILQKLWDVVIQIVELPLYILSSLEDNSLRTGEERQWWGEERIVL